MPVLEAAEHTLVMPVAPQIVSVSGWYKGYQKLARIGGVLSVGCELVSG